MLCLEVALKARQGLVPTFQQDLLTKITSTYYLGQEKQDFGRIYLPRILFSTKNKVLESSLPFKKYISLDTLTPVV